MDIDKNIQITPGLVMSFIIIAVPSVAWLIGYDFNGVGALELTGIGMEKIAAFSGMSMFALSLILSGRYKILDTWFRGLDKVYIAHRFFATASVALLLMHPLGYTISSIAREGTANLLDHYIGYSGMGVLLGRIALYALVFLVIWSIFARVKHETFITVHRWLGVLFIMGATHAFMSGSVLSENAFMWWYMFILTVIASLTFIHYSLLADALHPYLSYKVSKVENLPGDIIDIEMRPRYRMLNFAPGQFIYISFEQFGFDVYHPFSIASSNKDSTLRLIIKQLGDHTIALKDLNVGTLARVKGPFGGFTFNDKKHPKQLWIAGGIGITPFLSKAHSLRHSSQQTPEITMLHFARTTEEAVDRHELDLIEKTHKAFSYTCLDQEKFGIVSLKAVTEQLGPLDDYAIYMCGPPPMLNAYEAQAKELGLDKQLYFEEFNY